MTRFLGVSLAWFVVAPAHAEPTCRDSDAVLGALNALEPSPWDCLKGVRLGPAGIRIEVDPSGHANATIATTDATARACVEERLAAFALAPAACELAISWPMSMDAWPAASVDVVLKKAPALGAPSGHCPAVGAPEERRYGSTWRPIGFSPRGAFAYAELQGSDLAAAPSWSVVVVSLVEDERLGAVAQDYPEPPPLDTFLADQRPAIDALLETHGIEPHAAPLSDLPWAVPEGQLHVVLSDVGDPADHPHHTFRVTAERTPGGTKHLGDLRGMTAKPLGLMVSPHEPRGAIVFVVDEVAPEATLNCRIRVMGAHLERGFSAP